MCGIFGVIAQEKKHNRKELLKILEFIGLLSQVRGKDSSGICFRDEAHKTISVLKGPFSLKMLLNSSEYQNLRSKILKSEINYIFTGFGHARLVTNGTQLEGNNNQPVIKDGIVGIHNGIITNIDELWKKHNYLKREFEIDTEFFFSYVSYLMRHNDNGEISSELSTLLANKEVFGTVSVAYFNTFRDDYILFTNFGSLYVLTDNESIIIFGSERNILLQVVNKFVKFSDPKYTLKQVKPLNGYHIELKNFVIREFNEKRYIDKVQTKLNENYKIEVQNLNFIGKQLHAVIDPKKYKNIAFSNNERKLLEYNIEKISKLKRCTKCILPETFPFIEFDENGVCNYCRNYIPKNQPKPLYELEKLVEPYRKKSGEPDCLVPYSGGRDSTFTLHFVKKILGLNPIAFTYDWGMVTDLARRNIARVTSKLQVENIIVAADIHWKRKNIQKNILAWLKKPHLGMVPLFMAGDKYFYYYTHQVKLQNNIKLNIWGINPLENTDFKTGFAGIPPNFNKERIFSLRLSDQLKLFYFVSKNVLSNPYYLNQSVLDSIGSIFSRYFFPKKDYYHFFDYYKWDEEEIENLIINEYEWELAIDTNATWRIGDGTASFYNYIYYTVAGFSEFDTFRSNQIREGAISREKALEKVNEENKPRYETLKWYLEIIGLDFENVIKRVNQIPKLY
ncbi:MAG: glucosamine 6-phosphate synthetase [Ignavibacteria bacterium]|jgi:hypothetical protein|nr:glucosamine 6-phosphate synthetase [Ignavibacteria bacterium]MDH7527477.1 glucosamine 6-phosphate synthetase [Ignavibacteria bacterium]